MIDDGSDESVELVIAFLFERLRVQRRFRVGFAATNTGNLCLETCLPSLEFRDLFGSRVVLGFGCGKNAAGSIDCLLESLPVDEFVACLGLAVEISGVFDFVSFFFAFLDAFSAGIAETLLTEDDALGDDGSVQFIDDYIRFKFCHNVLLFVGLLLMLILFGHLTSPMQESPWGG